MPTALCKAAYALRAHVPADSADRNKQRVIMTHHTYLTSFFMVTSFSIDQLGLIIIKPLLYLLINASYRNLQLPPPRGL